MIAGADAGAWCESTEAVADQMKIAVDVHRLGASGVTDPDGACAAAYHLSPRDAVLVRPDGFVAWQGESADGAAAALAQLLDR